MHALSADARVLIKNAQRLKDAGVSVVFSRAVCFLRLLLPKPKARVDEAFVKRDLCAAALGRGCDADQTGALLGVFLSSINR